MEDEDDLREKLEHYKVEHRDLDVIIEQLQNTQPVDFLRRQCRKARHTSLTATDNVFNLFKR